MSVRSKTRCTAKRRRLGVAGAACAGLLVVSCGSGSETGAGSPPDTSGLRGEPVEIGLIIDLSNNQGAFDGFENAYQASVDAVNADGGIDGRPLRLEVCDSARDPNETAQCARELVDAGVPAVLSLAYLGTYLPILEDAGIANIGNTLSDPAMFTSEVSFPLWAGGIGGEAGAGVMLGHRGCTKAAGVSSAPGVSNDVIMEALDAGAEVSGVPVELVTATPGAPDMSSAIAAAADAEADCLVLNGASNDIVAMIRAARQFDPDLQLFSFTGLLPSETLASLGEHAEGLNLIAATRQPSAAEEVPAVEEWVQAIEDYSADPKTTEDPSAQAYAALRLFAHVASEVETIDAASILEALNALQGYDSGLTPPVSFNTPGTTTFGPRVFSPYVVFTHVEDGVVVEDTGEFVHIFTNEPAA